jgi:hypothetical protein
MQEFKLTIIKESRLVAGLFLLPIGILGSIFLGAKLGGIIWVAIIFAAFLALVYFYLVGHLTIIATKESLQFQWTKKALFGYNAIEPVNFADIKTLVIDEGQMLKKVLTLDRTITINANKLTSNENQKLIHYITPIIRQYNINVIDSWDVASEKNYFKAFYWINTIVLVIVGIIIIIAIVMGVYTFNFFWVLALLPQQFFLRQQMKEKLTKKKLQQKSIDTISDEK